MTEDILVNVLPTLIESLAAVLFMTVIDEFGAPLDVCIIGCPREDKLKICIQVVFVIVLFPSDLQLGLKLFFDLVFEQGSVFMCHSLLLSPQYCGNQYC